MSDFKMHIPARTRRAADGKQTVKLTPEAYDALIDIYNESSYSLKQIASLLILEAAKNVVFDKEEDESE